VGEAVGNVVLPVCGSLLLESDSGAKCLTASTRGGGRTVAWAALLERTKVAGYSDRD
jgi:hypothetical protein